MELRFNTADAASGDAVSSGTIAAVADTDTYMTASLILDTAVNTEFVGQTLRVLVFNNDGSGQLAVDNVSVSVIPEPATMVLLGLGGFLLRRKRR